MMKKSKTSSAIGGIAVFFLCFSTILQTYGYGGFLNFSRIIGLVVAGAYIIHAFLKKFNLSVLPKSLTYYFFWLLIVAFLSATTFLDFFPLGDIERICLFLAIFSFVDYNCFFSLYKKTAYVCIFFLLFQETFFLITGYRISGIVQFFPLDFSENVNVDSYLDRIVREDARSSSLFSEPSHFVQYVLPLFAIELFGVNLRCKKGIFKLLIIVLSILLTKSGTGLLGLFSICLVYFFYLLKSSKVNRYIILPFFLLIVIVGGLYYMKSESGTELVGRQEELTSGLEASSGFIRVLRGYYVYAEYSPLEKIIGINNLNKLSSRINSSIVSKMFLEGEFYFNTFQNFLLRTGIIGAIFFFVLFIGLMRKNTYTGIALAFCFMIMSFYTSQYLSSTMILYVFLSYSMKNSKYQLEYAKNNARLRNSSRSN